MVGKVFTNLFDAEQMITNLNTLIQNYKCITTLSHNNIVGIKGVCFVPDKIMPVLLMEKMTNSLQYQFKHHPYTLSVTRIIEILYDTASGLNYLHSLDPPFIHENLTTDHVLLDVKFKAKIGGFSITKHHLDEKYRPPEALNGSRPLYPTLDIFSFGHLALCTVLQEEIGQLLPLHCLNEASEPSICNEVNRRALSMKKAEKILCTNQSLLEVIKDCLSNDPTHRPSATKLFQILQEAGELILMNESVKLQIIFIL